MKNENYKSILNNDGTYYLDFLAFKILDSIYEMKELYNIYLSFENNAKSDDDIYWIRLAFSEMKDLFWFRFCVQMRDFINTIHSILYKNKKIKSEYIKVSNVLIESSFFKFFWLEESNNYFNYQCLSYSLHNYNNYEFSNSNDICNYYPEYNIPLSLDIEIIEQEFTKLITIFRNIDNVDNYDISLSPSKLSPIFIILNKVISNKK